MDEYALMLEKQLISLGKRLLASEEIIFALKMEVMRLKSGSNQNAEPPKPKRQGNVIPFRRG